MWRRGNVTSRGGAYGVFLGSLCQSAECRSSSILLHRILLVFLLLSTKSYIGNPLAPSPGHSTPSSSLNNPENLRKHTNKSLLPRQRTNMSIPTNSTRLTTTSIERRLHQEYISLLALHNLSRRNQEAATDTRESWFCWAIQNTHLREQITFLQWNLDVREGTIFSYASTVAEGREQVAVVSVWA